MKKEMDVKQFVSVTFFVEKIVKPSGDVLILVRGGSPQMPQTLFVGSPDEYCDFIHNM